MKTWTLVMMIAALAMTIPATGIGKVITLFDEEEDFPSKLPNHDQGTEVSIETKDVFRGKMALKFDTKNVGTAGQAYNGTVPNWTYAIVEKPSKDLQARWILFAWKKSAGKGIMMQFPDNGAWGAAAPVFVEPPAPGTRRYIAGDNLTGWSGIQVSKDVPTKWTYVLRDLWGDFTNFTLTGVAFTQFDNIGYYDALFLAWEKSELEDLLAPQSVEPQGKLAATWGELKSR